MRVRQGDEGQGVSRRLPNIGGAGVGIHSMRVCPGAIRGSQSIQEYMRAIARRLRYVRVCCGDWARVVTHGALTYGRTVGVLLDPPYSTDERRTGIYSEDGGTSVSDDVREWCLEHGEDRRLRIALCGYDGEHEMPSSWDVLEWTGHGGYGNLGNGEGAANRHRERIWLSPGCVGSSQLGLFGGGGEE